MNHRRIDTLERHFRQVDDEPDLQSIVVEHQRLDAWLAEQGYSDDPHGAMAAGLHTPDGFRFTTIEDLARAAEECEIYRWIMYWGFVMDGRRRLADPRYATDYFELHLRSQIEESTRDAEEARAKLASWGISVEDALCRARAMHAEARPNGWMTDEELERIVAAVLDAGQEAESGG